MIRIIRTQTLAALRDDADRNRCLAEDAGQAVTEARHDAKEARRIAEDWRSFAADAEDARKRAVAARVKADDTTRYQCAQIRELRMRLGEPTFCPLPYAPGGEVPCAAAGKCMRPAGDVMVPDGTGADGTRL